MRNPCQSLPAISLVLLLGATLPQEAQSFNAIINSNPVTIWLYNYFRSNDCFGLPFCDILAAVEDETNATDVIDDAGVAGEFDLPDIVLYEGDDDDDANTDNNDNGNSIGSLGEFTLSDLFGGLNNEGGDQNEQGEMQQVPLGDGPPGATQNEEDVNEQQLLQQVPLGDGPPGENQNVNGGSPPQVIQMPEFSETEEEGEESSSGGLVSTGIAAIENVINEGIDLIGRINFFGGRDNKGRQRRRHLRHLH
jgi:hypothetical protein